MIDVKRWYFFCSIQKKDLIMKNTQILIFIFLLAAAGCRTAVNVTSFRENAEKAEADGEYVIATEAWKFYFNQLPADHVPEDTTYARAAFTAYRGGDALQTIEWFEKAREGGYQSPEMHLLLAEIHRTRNNTSNELAELEFYVENYDEEQQEVYKRLFDIYYTSNRLNDAMAVWDKMPDVNKGTEQTLERYFVLNKQLENDVKADSVSLELIKLNPGHVDALEWQAQKNYEKGEARYAREMKKYEAHPTAGSYQTLLRQLKAATADLRKSLQYFEKLWEVNPESRSEYAVYMNNIHVRFNEKEKADYYRKYVN
jgi:tetratricopeptide (TPR) repeat protein